MEDDRLSRLRERLRELDSVLVAYSGGVDSTLLLKVARDELGDRAHAATVLSVLMPAWEQDEAVRFAAGTGAELHTVDVDILAHPKIATNPPDRCYHCKRFIVETLLTVAAHHGLARVIDGSVADDDPADRPGTRAAKELGVLSPLRECGLGKADVRELSRMLRLPTWDKPSHACLATRFPYDEPLHADELARVAAAEDVLRAEGVRQCRVRVHGDTARIEVEPDAFDRIAGELRGTVSDRFRALGFAHVALDLDGYRTGSAG